MPKMTIEERKANRELKKRMEEQVERLRQQLEHENLHASDTCEDDVEYFAARMISTARVYVERLEERTKAYGVAEAVGGAERAIQAEYNAYLWASVVGFGEGENLSQDAYETRLRHTKEREERRLLRQDFFYASSCPLSNAVKAFQGKGAVQFVEDAGNLLESYERRRKAQAAVRARPAMADSDLLAIKGDRAFAEAFRALLLADPQF